MLNYFLVFLIASFSYLIKYFHFLTNQGIQIFSLQFKTSFFFLNHNYQLHIIVVILFLPSLEFH